MLKTRIVQVDKTMAELYLSYEKAPEVGVTDTNRRHSELLVNEYMQAMLAGEWRLTHQGIGFTGYFDDNTAELGDGGQRLRALLRAAEQKPDIAIDFMVTEGLTREDVLAMDIGRKRTPADFMTMAGEAFAPVLAAVIKLSWLYEQNKLDTYENRRRTPLSPTSMKEFLANNPDLRLAAAEGRRFNGSFMAPSAVGTFWYLAVSRGYDQKHIQEFLDGLLYGENLSKYDGRLTLRELMLNSRKVYRRWESHEQLALLIKAFLRWGNGEEVKQLSFRVDELFPKL